jgi:filamentous hemagglutinin
MAGIGAPTRPSHRFANASSMPGLLPRRLRLGCSALALLAGLAAFGTMAQPARADGAKIVGMRLVRGDSAASASGGNGGGGNGGGSNSAVDKALSRAASSGAPKVLFGGMSLNRIRDAATNNPVIDATNKLMTIEQLKPKAVIDWNRFNIAGDETVRFDQKGNRDWAVLNRIGQADPSRIDGALKADGHVYLINQNGVIFGNGARVNVRNLVASSLNISDDQFNRGILDVRRDAAGQVLPAFAADRDAEPGQIKVERGAVIQGPDNGSVILLGGSVVNAGTIRAPAGQVVIGAGRKIYLYPTSYTATPTDEQYPRGIAIEVASLPDSDSPTANWVVNTGTIDTPRGGNVSITSLLIAQNGRISATTAVRAGGSILLKAAADPAYDTVGTVQNRNSRGKVTFGRGSSTTILPEDSADTITDAEQFEHSRVQVVAGAGTMERGSEIRAPAGDVTIQIAEAPTDGSPNRFTMERGSRIDVSGTTSTEVAMERNQISIALRKNELNSPLQRDGFLFGKTVNVDIREGSPIGSIGDYLKSTGRTATERSAVGGTVSISSRTPASGEVVIRDGATIDVSGGQVRYRGGWLDTTQLVGADGRVYDISQASPDIQYVAFAEDRYAQQKIYGPRWEAGYTDGMAAGAVNINTGAAVLDGRISGGTTPGARQRSRDQLPALGSLTLTLRRPVDVTFGSGGARLPEAFGSGDALPEDLRDRLVIAPTMVGAGGVDKIAVTTAGGDIAVARGATLRTAPGGSVDLRSRPELLGTEIYAAETALDQFGSITIAGAIETPSGTITLAARNLTLAAGARLTARGQWVNDRVDANGNLYAGGAGPSGAALPDGGTIDLSALETLTIARGSVIDVSAGGWVATDGSLTKGNGGEVRLATSRFIDQSIAIRPSAGKLVLGGDILGYGLDRGGKLTIRTDRIWIGGGLAPKGALVLDPGFLSRGGFSDVTLQGYRGVTVAANTVVTPAAPTLRLNPDYLWRAGGSDVVGFASLNVLPEEQRPAGSLTLIARGSDLRADDYGVDGVDETGRSYEGGGSVVFGRGSVVRMGMGGSVTAVAARTVRVDGTIDTPAGQITLMGGVTPDVQKLTDPITGEQFPLAAYDPEAGIRIGATGRLLARGAVRLDPTTDGTRRGTVLDGGTITLNAYNGALVVERGALLDVSGVSTDLDLRSMTMYGIKLRSRTVASDGGTIRLTASDGLYLDGTVLGRGGGAGAAGGTLITEMRQGTRTGKNRLGLPADLVRVLNIRQSGLSAGAKEGYDSDTFLRYAGQGFVTADTVMGGGFGTWVMGSDNVVNFNGDVTVKLGREIQIAAYAVSGTPAPGRTGSRVVLQAPRVSFTNAGIEPLGAPQGGDIFPLTDRITDPATQLSILADLIDINTDGLRFGSLYHVLVDIDPETGEGIYKDRSFRGFGSVRLESRGDIRFTGGSSNAGKLDTAGDLVFRAAQIYPATDQSFTVNALGKVTVQPNGKAVMPLSIGGTLTIAAPEIVQNGTIRAPLGRIILGIDGVSTVTLGRGSVTSVSAKGLTMPYGYVQNGSVWINPGGATGIVGAPNKEVRLLGTDVDVQEGAVIDVSGGGELLADEFIAGLGGPSDILNDPNSFAVIPDFDGYAPWDPYYSGYRPLPQSADFDFNRDVPTVPSTATAAGQSLNQGGKTSLRVGDRVYLSGGGGLPAGTYVLLPARYALMPGAYRVRAVNGILDRLPAMNGRAPDGSAYVAGRRSVLNTAIADVRWSGFQVESGAVLRQRAQYDSYEANSFFRSDAFLKRQKSDTGVVPAPVLPIDGGTLVAKATETLRLDGSAKFTPAEGGRLGRFDIATAKIAVVSEGADTQDLADQGYLLLQAEQLNDFGVGSLFIGGERSAAPVTSADPRGGTQVQVVASDVVVRNPGTALEGPEILLAAANTLTVESGSVTRATGADAGPADTLRLSGDSALLRVSTGDRVDVVRTDFSGFGGSLTIQDGAAVLASGSLALDATGDSILVSTQIRGDRAIDAAARQISFGDAPAGTGGLVFRDGTLGVLAQTETLTLRGYNSIDFYGNVTVGAGQGSALQTLSLDSPLLAGHGGNATINAGAVQLRNTGNASDLPVDLAGGSLTINATTRMDGGKPVESTGRIDLADGPVRIAGFGTTTLAADERIIGTSGLDTAINASPGSGGATRPNRLQADGALTLTAAALSAGTGSDNAIAAGGALAFSGRSVPNLPEFDEIGGRLRLSGDTVALTGRIEVSAGILEASATHNLEIAGNTTIDAAGVERHFFDQTRYAPGGVVKLSSAQGDVILAGGSTIAIGGGPGGDAGRLIVDASHGRFVADGTIDARSATGTRHGQVDLDLGRLDGSFDTLAGKLAAAGFAEAQRLRIRSGDVTLSAGQTITAREVALSVDGGNLTIGGTIDAGGATGGDIRLAAGRTLTLANGAVLNASGAAADAAGQGGSVLLAAGDGGQLDLQSGSTISVGAGGATGSVHLRAPRSNGDSDVAITQLGSQIGGAREITVEAYKAYNDASSVDASVIQADLDDFAAKGVAGRIADRFGPGVTARAGVELRSTGDITLDTDLDLHALMQGRDGASGILTLRAGGDLTFLGSLSDGFTTIDGNTLAGGDSWSYRLVAGADLSGADPLALLAAADLATGKGSVAVDSVTANRALRIRTGTGDIDIAAARDFVLGARSDTNLGPDFFTPIPQAVLYTAGQPITDVPGSLLDRARYPDAAYPTGGGDIGISAGGSLYGVPSAQLISDYVWRQGDSDGDLGLATTWWIDFGGFQQGVGALAGGNVALRAGDQIRNLSAVIPTVGWVSNGSVTVRNGGSLTVDALGDIVSGVYYVGRGDATIESGGAIKGGASVTPFQFGFPSGQALAPRTILAGGDTDFHLRSRGDLTIETVLDPMMLPVSLRQEPDPGSVSLQPYGGFFSRGPNSAVSLDSIGGDVRFGNDANTVTALITGSQGSTSALYTLLYPSTVRATSFSGDIVVDGGMVLASADRSALELLAADDVLFRPNGDPTEFRAFTTVKFVAMADAASQFVPTALNPVFTTRAVAVPPDEELQFQNAHLIGPQPLDQAGRHVGDPDPARIYAVGGDVRSVDPQEAYRLIMPKSLQLRAGADVADLSITATNTNPGDVTVVQAGRDIDLTTGLGTTAAQILVGGPGRLQVIAGRDIDLGYGQDILTDGNLRTSALPDQGADIAVLAGLGGREPDRTAFMTRYLDPAAAYDPYLLGPGGSIYTAQMIRYVEAVTGRSGLDAPTAFALFKALQPEQQDPLLQDILFAELRASGREANDASSPRFGATDRGYAAADVLFPGDGWSGGITMRESQIKTKRGGDISILLPGGGIQLGASATETGRIPKNANDSGLWTVLGGAIRVYAHDDILIRSSRALTAGGGDILMWSSFGDIDAGLGSRAAISTNPAIVRLSLNGTLQVEPGGIVGGSGIGALQPPGDVDLYAPNGVINAGEGGIRVSGNFNVFALQVLNADNIQVGGQSVGLPTAPVNPASITGVSDVAAQATRAIEQSVRDQAERSAKPNDEAPPLLITGSFLGYEGS